LIERAVENIRVEKWRVAWSGQLPDFAVVFSRGRHHRSASMLDSVCSSFSPTLAAVSATDFPSLEAKVTSYIPYIAMDSSVLFLCFYVEVLFVTLHF
jgi:hypothetical protein